MAAPASLLFTKNATTASAEDVKKAIAKVVRPDRELNTLPPRLTEPKRVLLIVPPGTVEESYGRLSGASGELPMLGLAYIGAALKDQGHEVKIIDYEVNGWPLSKVAPDIAAFNPDVVGMTVYITNMRRCAAVAKAAKQVDPKITVVLGGPQVSIFPEEGFQSPHSDIVVLSEGEIIIRNVMNALGDEEKLKQVKGIWLRTKSGEIIRNEREGLAGDLDIFPQPAWDLYELEKYYPSVYIRGKKVCHFLTSRGCPFQCTFCETKLTFGRSFRYHTTERVLREIEDRMGHGFTSFQFYDDIFTANKKRVHDLCRGIIDKGWKIEWMCWTRTNCVDDETLALMKKAGCYMIVFGAESGDDELLKLIKKSLTTQQNFDGIQLAKKHGILTCSSFMLGLPQETREQTLKTIDFSIKSGLDYAVFPITEPYPGTELWVDAQKYGSFDTSGRYKNGLLSENSAVWVPHGRTREELESLMILAMRRFYWRPKAVWRGFLNFFHIPFPRAFRYFWSGVKFFFIGSRVHGTRS
jgi:anaerobic magnesium-protoporphyrin IX monomethyl ester cyclase